MIDMKNVDRILEIEALTENLTKHFANNNLLKFKVLYFISQYENLSVSMIIEKLGLKKSNFTLMAKELEQEGLVSARHGEIDKRCRLMALTEKGKQELAAFTQNLDNFFADANNEVEKAVEILCNYLNKKI